MFNSIRTTSLGTIREEPDNSRNSPAPDAEEARRFSSGIWEVPVRHESMKLGRVRRKLKRVLRDKRI